MKSVFTKPVAHFIPLAEGVNATTLSLLSLEKLTEVVCRCKEAEAQRIYHTNPDVIVREIGDQWVLVPTGNLAQQFNGMISLNIFSHFVWQQFEKPHKAADVLQAARTQFDDPEHMLDVQVRKLISDFARMGLFLKNE